MLETNIWTNSTIHFFIVLKMSQNYFHNHLSITFLKIFLPLVHTILKRLSILLIATATCNLKLQRKSSSLPLNLWMIWPIGREKGGKRENLGTGWSWDLRRKFWFVFDPVWLSNYALFQQESLSNILLTVPWRTLTRRFDMVFTQMSFSELKTKARFQLLILMWSVKRNFFGFSCAVIGLRTMGRQPNLFSTHT